MNKEVNEKKKKYAIVITFLVLMICITGGTYAYFALTASNNSVTGSVGGASINLEVTKIYPTSEHNNKNMIPQLESTLDRAISDEYNCVDDNGNVICQVYSATVTNVGSTSSVLNGTISFEGVEKEAGLYDDDWNLLASWDELVNDYGMDIEYGGFINDGVPMLSNIINDHPGFLSTTKIIVDGNVKNVGMYQFYGLGNVKEIALPDDVILNYSDVFYGLSSLEIVYYSGYDVEAPWGAENATIFPREAIDPIPNLKWMRINDRNTLDTYDSYYASNNKALFEENKSFGANASNTYYFVFWIDETGDVQTDIGTFRANIEFNSSTDGLTSTVRPLDGLFDSNGVKLASWKELVDNYGFDIEKDCIDDAFDSSCSLGGILYLNSELSSGTKLIIPDGITKIGNYAVSYSTITEVVIPDTVTSIGNYAFAESPLNSITIPGSVLSIGYGAFLNDSYFSLKNVIIEDGVKSIGDNAFMYNNIESAFIPSSIENVGRSIFEENYASSMTIYYAGTVDEWKNTFNEGNLGVTTATKYIVYNYSGIGF